MSAGIPLLLIQDGLLSVTGEGMCAYKKTAEKAYNPGQKQHV